MLGRGGLKTESAGGYEMRARASIVALVLTTGVALFGAAVPAMARGDYNGDGNIDLEDHARLPGCLAGPGGGLGPNCGVFDFDDDGHVDLSDLADFLRIFGRSIPESMVPIPGVETILSLRALWLSQDERWTRHWNSRPAYQNAA